MSSEAPMDAGRLDFGVDERVLINGKHTGTVRFLGTTQFKKGFWVGCELDRPLGKNDGEVRGVRYFRCKANHGVFVRPDQVEPFNREQQAAFAIQSAARMRQAKKRLKQERNWRTWNALDNHNEQAFLEKGKQFKQLGEVLKGAGSGVEAKAAATPTLAPGEIPIEADYEGAHVTLPLSLDSVLRMLEAFKHGRTLHYRYALAVIQAAHATFAGESTVQEITIPEGKKLTVVGDTHGQLQDLFTIFTINGLPSDENMYLFNGDFVDRGPDGMEVVLCMFAFKLLYPTTVFLNRGNHESRGQNSWMGFEDELLTKYDGTKAGDPMRARRFYDVIENCFDQLPLCAIVQEKVFVCHGGLFQRSGITINHIRAIKRKREAPIEGKSFEDRLYEELLWSDPRPTANYPQPLVGVRRSDRGAGVEFGPDVTNDFCLSNGIALVVRSHECVQEGYEVLHGGRLITIFSASRYCGTQTNKGAFITFGPDLQPEIQQFYAHSISSSDFGVAPSEVEVGRAKEEERREQALEDDAVQMIIERIVDRKADLFWYYTQEDTERQGSVTRLQWATGLSSVLELDLPWLSFQTRLAEAEEDGRVKYTKFLDRYQISMRAEDMAWQGAVVNRVCEQLFAHCEDMKQAFKVLDTNGDGEIEYEEFLTALRRMDVDLSDMQIYELMRSVDKDQNARIDYHEFVDRFEAEFASVKSKRAGGAEAGGEEAKGGEAGAGAGAGAGGPGRAVGARAVAALGPDARLLLRRDSNPALQLDVDALDRGVRASLQRVARALLTEKVSIEEAFNKFASGAGRVSHADFARVLEELALGFSPEQALALARVVDANGSGFINFREFAQAFRIRDKKAAAASVTSWQHSVVQQVANVLFQHRIQLRSAFRMFDTDNNGVISGEEFATGLTALNALLDKPLTSAQIDELMRTLDKDGNGTIDFDEFLEGFRVVDTGRPGASGGSSPGASTPGSGTTSPASGAGSAAAR